MYQKYRIGETDHFTEASYPQITADLKSIVLLLGETEKTPAAYMLLSFLKSHSISSKHVAAYPSLATMISTKELPLSALEELFEASKQNNTFQKALEKYVETFINGQKTKPLSGIKTSS